MGGWRPIETAPKDGTTILVWEDKAAEGEHIEIAYWDCNEFGNRWEAALDGSPLSPDFWMPLPEPPTEQERG